MFLLAVITSKWQAFYLVNTFRFYGISSKTHSKVPNSKCKSLGTNHRGFSLLHKEIV